MKSLVIGLFIAVAIYSIAPNRAGQVVADIVPDLSSEIIFERIYDGCEGCPDRKVVLRRERSKKFEDARLVFGGGSCARLIPSVKRHETEAVRQVAY